MGSDNKCNKATLVTSNYVTVSITLHLVVGMMITLFCVNLVAVS